MACSNCFNGCVDIISDQCVRYTGIDISSLGIQYGDPLSKIEQSLITFLESALNGTGIKPHIDISICDLVRNNLPTCGNLTLIDFLTALIKSVCDLQTQVNDVVLDISTINNALAELNATYTIPACITGSPNANSTHSVLQALLSNFCALSNSLPATYVAIDDIISIISAWFTTNYSSALISSRMVPYTAVPYFGTLANFGGTGEGLGNWINIYLCNGENATPDLRGRTVVGVTSMLGTVPLDTEVVTPVYTAYSKQGANTIVLSALQMPTHTHTALTTGTAPHSHLIFNIDTPEPGVPISLTNYPNQGALLDGNLSYSMRGSATVPTLGKTATEAATLVASTINATAGSSNSHSNIQPSMGAFYIMYIP